MSWTTHFEDAASLEVRDGGLDFDYATGEDVDGGTAPLRGTHGVPDLGDNYIWAACRGKLALHGGGWRRAACCQLQPDAVPVSERIRISDRAGAVRLAGRAGRFTPRRPPTTRHPKSAPRRARAAAMRTFLT